MSGEREGERNQLCPGGWSWGTGKKDSAPRKRCPSSGAA